MSRCPDPLRRYVERAAALDARRRAIERLEGEPYANAMRDLAVEKARLRRAWAAFRPWAHHAPSAAQMEMVNR